MESRKTHTIIQVQILAKNTEITERNIESLGQIKLLQGKKWQECAKEGMFT